MFDLNPFRTTHQDKFKDTMTYEKRTLKTISKIFIFATLTTLCLASCSTEEGASRGTPSPTDEQDSFVDMEEVLRQARVQTFQRMVSEGEAEKIISSMDEKSSHILIKTGVLKKEGTSYAVETTRSEWDITSHPSGENSISAVDSSLASAMTGNLVTWCGEPMPGSDFVKNYIIEHESSFNTNEEYEKSIADYVDCGTGEL